METADSARAQGSNAERFACCMNVLGWTRSSNFIASVKTQDSALGNALQNLLYTDWMLPDKTNLNLNIFIEVGEGKCLV